MTHRRWKTLPCRMMMNGVINTVVSCYPHGTIHRKRHALVILSFLGNTWFQTAATNPSNRCRSLSSSLSPTSTTANSRRQNDLALQELRENEFARIRRQTIHSLPFRNIWPFLNYYENRLKKDLNEDDHHDHNENHTIVFQKPLKVEYFNELLHSLNIPNMTCPTRNVNSNGINFHEEGWFYKLQFVDQEYLLNTCTKEKLQESFWYERHIYSTSQIPTRFNNLHDFYGHLIWLMFPKTKRLFNKLHLEHMKSPSSNTVKERSPLQNFLTLFDECGVVVFIEESSFEELKNLLYGMQFKKLFWNHRARVESQMIFTIFGHSIFDTLTQHPYIGYTTKCVALPLSSSIYANLYDKYRPENVYQHQSLITMKTHVWSVMDDLLLDAFSNSKYGINLHNTKSLRPLPLLGIPNYWNPQTESFYDNEKYFRKPKDSHPVE
ncbi:hypothetical protein FDP41_000994 [Naegleria fowleri]|uniref:Uncharacterized protein n=1 Tax=Naegleria fowleri TaxID=5763 RepID=A0A6A5BZ66_NAEFO|nr:uncharacterized protein FDP41_000994 [Naegleria fowleri]KAF0979841.1 hypothetical protein FDP41_000994 [Naegleria fowleri]